MNRKRLIKEVINITVFEGPSVLLVVVFAGSNVPEEPPWSLLFSILLYVYIGLALVTFPTRFVLSRESIRDVLIHGGWRKDDLEAVGFFWNAASVAAAASFSSCLQDSDGFFAKHQEMIISMFGPLIVFYLIIVVVHIGVSIFFQRSKDYFR